MMSSEKIVNQFSADRRVTNFLNALQFIAGHEISGKDVDLVMITFYGATKELLILFDKAMENGVSNEDLGGAIVALRQEVDDFFDTRTAVFLANMAGRDKTKN